MPHATTDVIDNMQMFRVNGVIYTYSLREKTKKKKQRGGRERWRDSLTAFSQSGAIYSASISRFIIYLLPARATLPPSFITRPGRATQEECSLQLEGFWTFALWREKSTLNL